MADDKILVELIADIKNFQSNLAKADKSLKGFSDNTKKKNKETEKSFQNFSQAANIALGVNLSQLTASAAMAIREFTVSSLKDFLKYEQAIIALEIQVGSFADTLIKDLSKASDSTVNSLDLVSSANKALALGIDKNQLVQLMKIATAKSKVMGTSVSQAFQDITVGIGRQSKLILDNLGIIIDATKAYKSYADSVGKSVDALSELERKIAFTNAVIQSQEGFVVAMDFAQKAQITTLQQYTAEYENFKLKTGEVLGKAVEGWTLLFDTIRNGQEEVTFYSPEQQTLLNKLSTDILETKNNLDSTLQSLRSVREEILGFSIGPSKEEIEKNVAIAESQDKILNLKKELADLEEGGLRGKGAEQSILMQNIQAEENKLVKFQEEKALLVSSRTLEAQRLELSKASFLEQEGINTSIQSQLDNFQALLDKHAELKQAAEEVSLEYEHQTKVLLEQAKLELAIIKREETALGMAISGVSAFFSAKGMADFALKATQAVTSSGVPGTKKTGLMSSHSNVQLNDFIMRPGQSPASFSPQDTVIGVKDLSLLGGKNIHVTVTGNNIYGTDPEQIANALQIQLWNMVNN